MHPFEMGDHDVSVEGVTVLDARVFHDVVCDCVPVFTGEVTSTARAGLGGRQDGARRRLCHDVIASVVDRGPEGVMTTT